MARQKLTKRQVQANKTKSKIFKVANELMEKKGFTNITIEDISKKAGVSVGAFYHYYNSKDDILYEIYKMADEYFKNEVAHQLEKDNLSSVDRIVLFFKFYAKYNMERGLENDSQIYNTKNKLFIAKDRYMINLLREIIAKGQAENEIFGEMTPESITEYLFIVGRGVVFDWCLHDGDYNLEEKMEKFMRRLVVIFK